MGPHRLNARLPGNAYTRAPIERYTSPPHDTGSRRPVRIGWDAEVRDTTALQFEVRCAEREELLEQAPWMGPGGQGTMFERPGFSDSRPVAFDALRAVPRATFTSLYGCRSPRLREVRIDLQGLKEAMATGDRVPCSGGPNVRGVELLPVGDAGAAAGGANHEQAQPLGAHVRLLVAFR